EEPVTLNLANCSAHAFFDTMLSPLELTLSANAASLIVTTQDVAESKPLIRIYFLEGLGEGLDNDPSSIRELIQSMVEPEIWSSRGSYFYSSIEPTIVSGDRPAFVISATLKAHLGIEKLLARLRQSPSPKPAMPEVVAGTSSNAPVPKKQKTPSAQDFDPFGAPGRFKPKKRNSDPFGGSSNGDPFGSPGKSDPFDGSAEKDPFGSSAGNDPFEPF
ncbi:MAG: hypothetical protein AAF664_12920, partial [Planctomycetota bacterium]